MVTLKAVAPKPVRPANTSGYGGREGWLKTRISHFGQRTSAATATYNEAHPKKRPSSVTKTDVVAEWPRDANAIERKAARIEAQAATKAIAPLLSITARGKYATSSLANETGGCRYR